MLGRCRPASFTKRLMRLNQKAPMAIERMPAETDTGETYARHARPPRSSSTDASDPTVPPLPEPRRRAGAHARRPGDLPPDLLRRVHGVRLLPRRVLHA